MKNSCFLIFPNINANKTAVGIVKNTKITPPQIRASNPVAIPAKTP